MSNLLFERPILNSPYEIPTQHWGLDSDGQPTQKLIPSRRESKYITPVPQAKKKKSTAKQQSLGFDEGAGLSRQSQVYDASPIINQIRGDVDQWPKLPNSNDWLVTPETARLLKHWRDHKFDNFRLLFCQVEADEVAIWLSEVAPKRPTAKKFLDYLENVNNDASPELIGLALNIATAAGQDYRHGYDHCLPTVECCQEAEYDGSVFLDPFAGPCVGLRSVS